MDASFHKGHEWKSKAINYGSVSMFGRLKTHIWVSALLRRAQNAGAYGVIVQKGDEDAGTVLIKVRSLDDMATFYRPIHDMGGERAWLSKGPEDEKFIDDLISKHLDIDPDVWVIEIEDKKRRHFLTEPLVDPAI